jgi:hypothetical protein
MNLNISPNAVASKLISSLIKSKRNGEAKTATKEGIDLSAIALKLFSKKQAKMNEEKKGEETSNE